MPTMNVSLTDKMVDFVEREVASGDYASASELVRDALRLLERERDTQRAKLRALRDAIEVGDEEGRRGDYAEIDVAEMTRDILQRRRD